MSLGETPRWGWAQRRVPCGGGSVNICMSGRSWLGAVVVGTAALATLAGCSNGSLGAPANGLAGGVFKAASARPAERIFVSFQGPPALHDYVSNDVGIFTKTGKLIATLTGFNDPDGLAVDTSGNLYVVDFRNERVQVYAAPYHGSPTTLVDPGQMPLGVAVDRVGTVAVANIFSTAGQPNVSFYAKGATSPTNTVSNAAFAEIYLDAFDARGNLYLTGIDSGDNTLLGVVWGGIKGKAIKILTTANTISFPGAVQVTTKGLIAIEDLSGPTIYTYNPPNRKTGSLGKPVATTQLQNAGDFAFKRSNAFVFVANGYDDSVDEYAYPAGGSPVKTFRLPSGTSPVDMAVYPPEIP
jgi:hypothetical protein